MSEEPKRFSREIPSHSNGRGASTRCEVKPFSKLLGNSEQVDADLARRSAARIASQALKLVRSRKPDLLLLDYHLPGMNGLDLYHRLHAQSAYADIPALFLSSDALQSIFKREQLAFLSKPFEIEDFLRQIEALLSG